MIAVNDFSIKWVRASSQTILLDVAMITKKAACLRGLFGIVNASQLLFSLRNATAKRVFTRRSWVDCPIPLKLIHR
jgi:hypothetical protein